MTLKYDKAMFTRMSKPDFSLAVSMGLVPGFSRINKFGENADIDTGSTPEDIWEGGGEYIYDADGTDPIRYLSCANTLDVGQIMTIEGLDIDGNDVVQTVITNSQNVVLLDTPLWRCFGVGNDSPAGGDLAGIVYVHIDPAPLAGVPADVDVRAEVDNRNNQTLMAIYTIPLGFVGFFYRGEVGMSRAQVGGAVRASYYSRRFGGVFKVEKRVAIANSGSSAYQDTRSFPSAAPALTDVKLTVESVTANNSGVFGSFEIMLVEQDKLNPSFLAAIGQPGT